MERFIDLAKERFSVRDFKPDPIDAKVMEEILEAGRLAPTARNLQAQKVYVLESPEALAKIRSLTPCAFNAPTVLMVCYDRESRYADMDSSIIAAHMMFCAWDNGVGSTWVKYFDTEEVHKAMELPKELIPVLLMPMGYASESAVPSDMHSDRKPLTDTVVKI